MRHREKYKVIRTCEYYGRFTGILYPYDPIQYLIFTNVLNETNQVRVPSTLFISTCNFYQFVSQKPRIQSDMEHRAVNKIVQRILCDPCFQW